MKYIFTQIYVTTYMFFYNIAHYIKKSKLDKPIRIKHKRRYSAIYPFSLAWQVFTKLTVITLIAVFTSVLCFPPVRNLIDVIVALISAAAVTSMAFEIYYDVKASKKYPHHGSNHNEKIQSKYGKTGETQC